MTNTTRAALVVALGLSACTYDLDKLYEHGDAAVTPGNDGGTGGIVTSALIGAWVGTDPLVDQDCVSCAEQKCADAETACRGDAECVAFTQCVGANPNPPGMTACRQQHVAWVRQDVRNHDISGPYGQCVFKFNCSAECGGNDDLSCLQKYSWPSTPASTVPLHLYLADAVNTVAAVSGVSVKVCAATDTQCTTPVSQGVSDAAGLVELTLPTSYTGSFTGFLDIQGGTLYPTLLKFSWSIAQETTYLLNTVNKDLFNQSINAIGLKPDPTRGMLQLRMLGCDGIGLRGASFASDRADAQSATWYIDVLPKLDATQTTTVGSGGIIDIPEGLTTATATRASDNAPIGRADAPIRAGFMTVIVYEPLSQ